MRRYYQIVSKRHMNFHMKRCCSGSIWTEICFGKRPWKKEIRTQAKVDRISVDRSFFSYQRRNDEAVGVFYFSIETIQDFPFGKDSPSKPCIHGQRVCNSLPMPSSSK